MYGDEQQLDNLFAAYREALPDPEPGAGFMPGVWAKIESRRRSAILLRRLTGAFVTLAVVFSLMMSFFIARPHQSPADLTTYVETLDEEDFFLAVSQVDASPVGMRHGFNVE